MDIVVYHYKKCGRMVNPTELGNAIDFAIDIIKTYLLEK